jgi:general secretion pathway protein G
VRKRLNTQAGFTLVEIIVVIIALGILGSVAIAKYAGIVKDSKIKATQSEMSTLKRAIVGNPQIVSGGKYTDVGYLGHLGSPPTQLNDLVVKPGSIAEYNAISGLGWNGPYLNPDSDEYLYDAWGEAYVYDPMARTIKSVGSGQDILVSF